MRTKEAIWRWGVIFSLLFQVGCVTFMVLALMLGLGVWLDQTLNTKPIFIGVGLMASIPITVLFSLIIVRRVVRHIVETIEQTQRKEE